MAKKKVTKRTPRKTKVEGVEGQEIEGQETEGLGEETEEVEEVDRVELFENKIKMSEPPEETKQKFLNLPVENAKPQRDGGKEGYQEQALPYSEKDHTPGRPFKHALPETQDQRRARQRETLLNPDEEEMEEDKANKAKEDDDPRLGEYEGKFWRSTTHITGFGTVNGKATREQLRVFLANINPESDLDDWLSDKDEYTEYVRKHSRRKPNLE
jgi:hypothetical protein